MNLRIEVDHVVALPAKHAVRAFHGAGWVVTAPWGPVEGMIRVTGPDSSARDLRVFDMLAVDTSASGDVVILEADPESLGTEEDGPPFRIRLVSQEGAASSVPAQAIASLRFDNMYGAVAFGPPGTIWLCGCDVSQHESIWLGLVDLASGAPVAGVTLLQPYPGPVWLHRGPSPDAILVFMGAGQHGQWHFLVEFRDGALAWRQLGSASETTPASFSQHGTEFVAAVDWSQPTLTVGRVEDGGTIRSARLPYPSGYVEGVFAVDDHIVVAWPEDPRLDVFDWESLDFRGTIELEHDLEGETYFHAGRFVSAITIAKQRHWMVWRIVR